MFDRQRREVRVARQVACRSRLVEESLENCQVTRSGLKDNASRACHPLLHVGARVGGFQRLRENAVPGANPDEGKKSNPRKRDSLATVERLLQPASRNGVLLRGAVDRVKKNVGVDESHSGLSAAGKLADDLVVFEFCRELQCLGQWDRWLAQVTRCQSVPRCRGPLVDKPCPNRVVNDGL